MDNIEIILLLSEALRADFLDSYQLLAENQKKYKKSKFYKLTKIKLFDLYKLYADNYKFVYDLSDKINEIIGSLDTDELGEKIAATIASLQSNETVQNILSKLMANFDINKILGDSEELKELLINFKK